MCRITVAQCNRNFIKWRVRNTVTPPRYILRESSGRTTDKVHKVLRYVLSSHCVTKCVLPSLPTQTHACDNSVPRGMTSALMGKAQQQQYSILSTFGFNTNSAVHVTVKSQFQLGLTPVTKSVIKCRVFNAIQAMTKDNKYSCRNSWYIKLRTFKITQIKIKA
jgi:hypothetical protein